MDDAAPGRAMQIGELAERIGLSLHTVRHYDEVGLVQPSRRSEGGFRLYSEEDLQRFLLIKPMKPLGFSLEEMRALLDVVDALPETTGPAREALLAELRAFVTTARQRREKIVANLRLADRFIEDLQERDPA